MTSSISDLRQELNIYGLHLVSHTPAFQLRSHRSAFPWFFRNHLKHGKQPEDLYQRLIAFTEDNLLRSNSIQHHGVLLTEDEELTPHFGKSYCTHLVTACASWPSKTSETTSQNWTPLSHTCLHQAWNLASSLIFAGLNACHWRCKGNAHRYFLLSQARTSCQAHHSLPNTPYILSRLPRGSTGRLPPLPKRVHLSPWHQSKGHRKS